MFGLIWAGLIIASANMMLNDFRVISGLFAQNPALTPTAWTILEAVENGIISGNELVGSLWVSLSSLAAMRAKTFSRGLNILGASLGIVGLATLVIPEVSFIFGLGVVVWSIWLGIILLREKPALISERN